jgi:hypothetical protein
MYGNRYPELLLLGVTTILSEDLVKVARSKDIQLSHMKEGQLDGEDISIVNVEGKYMAVWNRGKQP